VNVFGKSHETIKKHYHSFLISHTRFDQPNNSTCLGSVCILESKCYLL